MVNGRGLHEPHAPPPDVVILMRPFGELPSWLSLCLMETRLFDRDLRSLVGR